MYKLRFIFLTIFMFILRDTQSEYYTSIFKLTKLLNVELSYINKLEEYLDEMEYEIQKINKSLAIMEKMSTEFAKDPHGYVKNPLNAFKVIRRFAIDWNEMKKIAFNHTYANAYLSNNNYLINIDNFTTPTKRDLQGATKGLVRMQRIYAQDTEDVAKGQLMKMNFNSAFSASDCFHIGRTLYELGDYEYATKWLMEARIRLRNEEDSTLTFPYVSDVQILNHLSTAMHFVGNNNLASVLFDELLAQASNNSIDEKFLQMLFPTIEYLGNKDLTKILNDDELLAQDSENKSAFDMLKKFWEKDREERRFANNEDAYNKDPHVALQQRIADESFEKTCRGEVSQTPREKRHLRCRYVHNNVPFCLIAPFKKEELHDDPEIVYYHEVIYKNEIEKLLNVSKDNLKRSLVAESGESSVTEDRTSQSAAITLDDCTFIIKLAQRMMDMTGLSLISAEALDVINYGISGHYAPHYDFARNLNYTFDGLGNRILSALFYLSDVKLGGGTAFPYIPLLVEPIKGSMLMWYDLHKSLEFDYRTMHGGCPVLVGSKWICTEWIHEIGQEFKRPCGLKPDGYKSIKYMQS